MGKVINLRAKLAEPLEEQEAKQFKRRTRGQGIVYLRGSKWWIQVQYRADSKVCCESAKTGKKTDAIGDLKKKVVEIAQVHRPSREFNKTTFQDLKALHFVSFEKRLQKGLGKGLQGCRV